MRFGGHKTRDRSVYRGLGAQVRWPADECRRRPSPAKVAFGIAVGIQWTAEKQSSLKCARPIAVAPKTIIFYP